MTLAASILLSGYYVATESWIASNIIAISFALNAVQLFSLDSFKTGMVLLSGMTMFDLLWTFHPEIVVSVAKNFDGPIKDIFPRLLLGLPAGQAYKFAALSLGDIVIPGVFAALCLRFDQHRAGTKNGELGRSTQFHKPYFSACIVAYLLGFATANYMAHVLQVIQPTILYLSSACILSVLMTAVVRGEMKQVFAYMSEEGLEAARAKREAQEKKRRQQQARTQASRYAPRVTRLPNIIKEESPVPSMRLNAEPSSATASEK
jgi:minor histocompatibility antigen H13